MVAGLFMAGKRVIAAKPNHNSLMSLLKTAAEIAVGLSDSQGL